MSFAGNEYAARRFGHTDTVHGIASGAAMTLPSLHSRRPQTSMDSPGFSRQRQPPTRSGGDARRFEFPDYQPPNYSSPSWTGTPRPHGPRDVPVLSWMDSSWMPVGGMQASEARTEPSVAHLVCISRHYCYVTLYDGITLVDGPAQ